MTKLYLIGSLREPSVPITGARLRQAGFEVFDDWFAAGPEADDKWKEYEEARGRTYIEALEGYAARNVFDFDHRHITSSDAGVLALPAGKSGHTELGMMMGMGKRGYILLDRPDRWDVMYRYAIYSGGGVFVKIEDLIEKLTLDFGIDLV